MRNAYAVKRDPRLSWEVSSTDARSCGQAAEQGTDILVADLAALQDSPPGRQPWVPPARLAGPQRREFATLTPRRRSSRPGLAGGARSGAHPGTTRGSAPG